mmetsp:Transcript_1316/g.1809  ORF Transcript_1316/g.1809 Transcript_1316/m.1809 type:complete len:141 (+) Transcript_1316:76-498(+)|eukprot:CAMPEP_0194780024 /NCGR_PEP_ID=MMETSP0323_2-20130528/72574_1 /TAXON_ID=2866 ORGANISM="Crypthecodinium cohnii, Strain Seligo" /NCGR_SAMPLE_ID=MMETSP0323_2 /ASSEMBLY_ACC=CAM_ASM_000346 /LENGTH=140 /DNA_ID=CAMNT_0039717883 /DNA_START=123 /DNA_END=545 /DNA_ORIENTATION=+
MFWWAIRCKDLRGADLLWQRAAMSPGGSAGCLLAHLPTHCTGSGCSKQAPDDHDHHRRHRQHMHMAKSTCIQTCSGQRIAQQEMGAPSPFVGSKSARSREELQDDEPINGDEPKTTTLATQPAQKWRSLPVNKTTIGFPR